MATQLFCSYFNTINWLQNNLLPCPFKKLAGIDCPLCGLQRSVLALIQGDFMASFKYHPATPLFILALVLSIPDSRLNFRKKSLVKKTVFALLIVVTASAYVYKITSGRL